VNGATCTFIGNGRLYRADTIVYGLTDVRVAEWTSGNVTGHGENLLAVEEVDE
jgi:hypothetical protein